MSWNRYAKKADDSQQDILDGLKKAGYRYWVIQWPDDILVWHPRFGANWFRMLSAKTLDAKGRFRKRNDQKDQDEFCATTGTPRVGTAEQAIRAMEAA